MKNLKSSVRKIASSLFVYTLIGLGLQSGALKAQTQLPECQSVVPFFVINLSSDPDSTYTTPEIVRNGQCCGDNNNQNYVSFYVTLHPDVAMVEIGIAPGYADPGGSGFYRIITGGNLVTPGTCNPGIAGGTPTCITGVGPHKITYHKPGSNKVKYYLRQIPKPIFPKDDSTRVGCTKPLEIFGLNNIQITSINSSTGVTTPGAFNNLLSCTNCPNPVFTPGIATPTWIDYRISGTPQASACGTYTSVDTVRIYTFPELNANITPNPASFCSGGGGVLLTASGSGGLPPYTYTWRNSSNVIVGTGPTYNATTQENFTVEVRDQLNTATCLSAFRTVPVSIGNPPIVNAGADDTVCAQSPTIFLQGSVQFATGGIWTGGAGTFNPSNTSLLAAYTPTPAEISAGFVTLTLTSTGAGGGCANSSDQVTFYFSPALNVNPTAAPLTCHGNNTTINANATGGIAPLTYTWNTGATTSSINAPAGTYSVMVRDAIGCVSSGNITISEPPIITTSFSVTNESCNGCCDGEVTISIAGGVPPYSVSWSNGDVGLTADNLCYGIVTATITDAAGCVVSSSAVVNNPTCAAFNATASITQNILCYGNTNGAAIVNATGGTEPYTYSWNTSPVQNTQNASGLSVGTYTVTVTDFNGCISISSVTLTQPTILTNTMLHTDATSIGGTDGTATANPAGGTPPYTYAWNTTPPQNTQTATGLAAGVYQVLISDFNGCTLLDSVRINQPPCNNFILAVNTTPVTCHGQNNGAASLLIAHGTPPYTIVWSSGQNNVTSVSGLAAGTYTVTVTDASNCTTFRNFTITEPDPLTISLDATNISCFGANDGTIDLTVSGGTFPYTFSWLYGTRPFGSTEDLIYLSPGTYSVVVTDANGCSATASIGITQPAQLTASAISVDVTCNGFSNGSIDVTPAGGTMPYTYSWTAQNNPFTANTQDLSGLVADIYTLSITDASGCNLAQPFQVAINQPDTVIIRHVDVPCPAPGASTVTVNVDTITGGADLPYSVSFDNGVTFQSPGVYTATLALGNSYQLVARDSNGCLSPVFNLTLNPAVVIDSVVFNKCIPPSNTTIPVTVYPNGGDGGPYQVSTDGGVTFGASGTYVFNLNVNNNYNIVVRDARGCISLTTTITIPAELIATAVESAQVTCLGGSDGAINLTVTGGTTAYTYAWTGPGSYSNNTEDISGLQAGVYNVTVTDAFGCTATASATVTTVPDVTNPTISCPTNITTQNNPTICGALITYTTPVGLDNCPGASTTLTTGLASGSIFPVGTTTVTYTVTDTVGNAASCSFTVTVADTTKPVISNCPSNVTVYSSSLACAMPATWTAPTASDNCSIATFTSTHNPGDIFPIGITTVTYTATDINSNTSTCTFTVTVIDTVKPVISGCPTNITASSIPSACGSTVTWVAPTATDNCGSVTVTSTHNSGDFFPVGTTTVSYTFTDANNNSSICSFTVTVTDTIKPVISGCPGNITSPNNSTACGNTITWTLPTASDNCGIQSFTSTHTPGSFFPVGTTTVTYTATDIHNNVTTCSFTVTINDTTQPVIATCPSNISINSTASACGSTATWVVPTATDNCGTVTVTSSHNPGDFFPVGTTIVTYTFTDANNNSSVCSFTVTVTDNVAPVITGCPTNIFVSNDPNVCTAVVSWIAPTASDNCGIVTLTSTHNPGDTFPVGTTTVTYTFTDAANNVSTCSFTVTVNDTELPQITCVGSVASCDSNIIYSAPVALDNCAVSSVVLSSGIGSGNIYPVGTTIDTYTVTDIHGNTNTCSVSVTVHPTPEVLLSVTNVACFGDSTGSIDATINSGTPAFTYLWSNGETTEDVADLTPGVYSLTVTDFYGCSSSALATVTQPDKLIASFVTTDILCNGGNNGAIDVTVSGGVAPYTYNWSTSSTDEDLTGLTAGAYTLTVTDANNCSEVNVITLVQPQALSITSTSVPATCQAPNGIIDITVNGGTVPYSYSWSNGAFTQDLIGVATGTYTVTVTDTNGCVIVYSDSVGTTSNMQLTAVVKNALCYKDASGSIDLSPSMGLSPYTYTWSNGATSEDLSDLLAGSYTVTVTDANQCSITETFEITESDSLYVELTSPIYHGTNNISTYGGSDGSIELTVHGGTAPYTYSWSNGMTIEDISGLPAGTYSVIVTDANGCTAYGVIVLKQPSDIELPEGFSPNGDGKNDYFVVRGLEAYPDNDFVVYNRWGNVVYEKSGYANEWDGRNNSGENLPDATYFVILKISGKDHVYKGYVDLRRK